MLTYEEPAVLFVLYVILTLVTAIVIVSRGQNLNHMDEILQTFSNAFLERIFGILIYIALYVHSPIDMPKIE